MINYGTAYVDSVIVGPRQRETDPAQVEALAASMQEIGLMTPVSIYADAEDRAYLVAGLHRLEAARKLGWEEIACVFVDFSETERALWEVDENLCRKELSTEERREHLLRRKELWERRQNEVEKVGQDVPVSDPAKGGRGNKGFAADTAEKTGMSKRQINRLLAGPKPKLHVVNSQEDIDATQKQRLMMVWNGSSPAVQQWFREFLDGPVMDQTNDQEAL